MSVNEKFKEILVKCNNDIEEMKEAFNDFLNHKIEVGDAVKVIDWGLNYSCDYGWFLDHYIPKNLCLRYAYGKAMYDQTDYDEDAIFKVIAVYDGKALITHKTFGNEWGVCHLVDIDALIVV